MKQKKYSIITANYNGYHLMEKYFQSLENQTYKDFEVLIIDDNSTDNSYEELLKYKKASKIDIKLYKTKINSGPGVARNIGIDNATGEYITFIDNDDWVENNLLEEINNVLINKKYDCIIYDYYLDLDGKSRKMSSIYGTFSGNIEKKDAIRYIRNHSVCKFYKLEVLKKNKIRYPIIRRHEDIAFVGSALVKCNSFYYHNTSYYHYVQHKASLSRNNSINIDTLFIAFDVLKANYGTRYLEELNEKSVIDLLYNVVLLMCKNNQKNSDIKKFISAYSTNNSNWYKYQIINYVGISKKIFLLFIKYKLVLSLKMLSYIHTLLGG